MTQDSEMSAVGGSAARVEQLLAQARNAWRAGAVGKAEGFCSEVLGLAPENAEALHLLGIAAHGRGEADAAIALLTRACAQPEAPAAFHSNLAEICRLAGRFGEAVAVGRRAIALDPGLAAAWNNLGNALYAQGDFAESRVALERAATLVPDFAGAHTNLGNALRQLGDLEGARQAHLKAISLDPRSAEAQSNLAAALLDLGELDGAYGAARRAIELAPRLIDAYANAAAVESTRERFGEALRWLENALAFVPDALSLLLAQAHVLLKLGQLEAALSVSERALALHPEDGQALNMRGLALQALARNGEALDAFDRAAAQPSRPGVAAANKALLLMQLGRREEALAAFDRALALQPTLASAWFSRADAKRFAPDDPDIAAMEALLGSGRAASCQDRLALHFALGKAWLDAGEAARAFTHLAEGNRLKRSFLTYDAAAAERLLAAIPARFPRELLVRHDGVDAASELPVFVIGMPRSGSTLIEQILAAHPRMHGAGELPHLSRIAARLQGQGRSALDPKVIAAPDEPVLAEMGRDYLAAVAPLAAGAARLVDKMPLNFLHAGLIRLILPGARIIHIRRDAADTCLSCYAHLFENGQSFAYDLTELGRFHRAYEALMAHWRTVLPPERFLEIDYEAVVEDLEAEARRLIDFCGLPWDAACLRFHEAARPVRTASYAQVRQPLYSSSVGRAQAYRAYLAPLFAALAATSSP